MDCNSSRSLRKVRDISAGVDKIGSMPLDGLLPNLLAFNVGVEIGQLLALAVILIGMSYWRRTAGFVRHAYSANVVMMSAGFILVGMQLTGYFVSQ